MHPIILQVLGLSDADHVLDVKSSTGLIYVTLAPETAHTDEVWASISFDFDYEVSHHAGEIWRDEGYFSRALHPYSEIDEVKNITWQVVEVDGGNWTPSETDKAKIDELIFDYVLEHGDEQIEQCNRYEYY